ncbi:MAG: hypothetical protein FJ121_04540 [Deltaproteobacteria bacterium]|nr:hypothetical protein [Deltaproteobacteria bacterium]
MLFASQVPIVFSRLNLQADSATSLARKTETAKRLDYFHDSQLDHLETRLNQLFSDPSAMVKVCLNVVRKVIVNLAQVYREAPTRLIDGTDSDKELYTGIVESMALDVKLKLASRYAKLLKTILLRPVWRNERLDLDILTGNILDVETGESPEILSKVLVTDFGTSDKIEEVEYSYWTPETWERLNYRGQTIEEAANPYGVLPFLSVFDYPPPSSNFWLPGGDDLISMQEAVNLKLTDLLYLLSTQSFGVGYIKGGQGGGSLKVDPGSLVELPENGEIGFANQQARIEEVVGAIDKLIKWGCVSHGLSAASMSTDPQEASGLSKIVDTRELAEMRAEDVALWRSYEKRLFSLIRTVWNAHSPSRKLSESATLNIDFADPRPEVDPKSQAEAWEKLLGFGVISPVDIAMQQNPDLKTREEALAYLLQVQEESRELNSGKSVL